MGSHSEDSLETTTMYKLLIASVLAVATSLPIEDTAEVAAAKEVFNAAFAAAEAGEHINLRPVNDDAQAAQIATSYIADSEDVAAGGLAAKQAPAPVHEVPVPAALPLAAPNALPFAGYPYGVNALNVLGAYPGYAAGLPYATNIANIATYPYAGLPVIAAAPAAKSA